MKNILRFQTNFYSKKKNYRAIFKNYYRVIFKNYLQKCSQIGSYDSQIGFIEE